MAVILVIGKKYSSGMLGYYNRGKQFPQFINNSVNGAVQSVMLPAMSAKQQNVDDLKSTMRFSIRVSAYIVFPVMAGLIAAAKPLITILLTEKWLPCVPYTQIFCVALAVYPIHSCNLQAYNALGKSDIYLKLEIIKKGCGIVFLFCSVLFFDSIIMIAWSVVATSYLSFMINAIPNYKVLHYSYMEQLGDVVLAAVMSIIMGFLIIQVLKLGLGDIPTIMIQIVVGIVIYIILSLITNNDELKLIFSIIRKDA